ncbi:hypothetical protein NQ527_01280 [Eshraghiella crossota]|nr:hypothetical protein [Butyrivibrio crossotus]UWO50954.1 hypothetical protein NQ527_01280 [Butyrivibrio crossotus]
MIKNGVVPVLEGDSPRLIDEWQALGFLFESLCERDLKIYAESFGASLYHYQDFFDYTSKILLS